MYVCILFTNFQFVQLQLIKLLVDDFKIKKYVREKLKL